MSNDSEFPYDHYIEVLVRLMDILDYDDKNFATDEERLDCLRYAYNKTVLHFTEPEHQAILKVSPKRLQAAIQTAVRMTVYGWPKVGKEVMADLSIHWTYMVILDDMTDNPREGMMTFYQDLLNGREQRHPWWICHNQSLPTTLKHYGPFCALNIVRSSIDFFQGNWIETHNFKGFPGSPDYPQFLRRLSGLGHAVSGTLFPKAQFDEEALFEQLAAAVAQIENWMIWTNDMMSYYKEFFTERDQTTLVNNYAHCDQTSLDEALEKLTHDTILRTERMIEVFKDKDPKIRDTIVAYMHGAVTWHLSDARYKLAELNDHAKDTPSGRKWKEYHAKGWKVGAVDPSTWAYPTVVELLERNEMAAATDASLASSSSDEIEADKMEIEVAQARKKNFEKLEKGLAQARKENILQRGVLAA